MTMTLTVSVAAVCFRRSVEHDQSARRPRRRRPRRLHVLRLRRLLLQVARRLVLTVSLVTSWRAVSSRVKKLVRKNIVHVKLACGHQA